jgi:hypothetical protein
MTAAGGGAGAGGTAGVNAQRGAADGGAAAAGAGPADRVTTIDNLRSAAFCTRLCY